MATDLTRVLVEMHDHDAHRAEKQHIAHMMNVHMQKHEHHMARGKEEETKGMALDDATENPPSKNPHHASAEAHHERAGYHKFMHNHYKRIHQEMTDHDHLF